MCLLGVGVGNFRQKTSQNLEIFQKFPKTYIFSSLKFWDVSLFKVAHASTYKVHNLWVGVIFYKIIAIFFWNSNFLFFGKSDLKSTVQFIIQSRPPSTTSYWQRTRFAFFGRTRTQYDLVRHRTQYDLVRPSRT